MKKRIGLFVCAGLFFTSIQAQENQNDNKHYFEINKNLEIFNSVVKQLDMFYVDTVNVEKTVQSGIVSMLSQLDPYTEVYLTDEDLEDFTLLIKGEYAGVGSVISYRKIDGRDMVVVAEPYENMPAAKGGLKAGDIILAVDGIDMTTADKVPNENYGQTLSSKVTSHLKGQAGTEVTVRVERPGVKKPFDVKLVRETIQMPSVPYYGIQDGNVGYIAFVGPFKEKSAQDIKKAVIDLKNQGATSILLDLRNNGGGSMEEAIQIVNLFVPKGEVVVSTKGKMKQLDRVYRATLEPLDTEIPLAVLVNKNSASASEIVSGALQDLDRAAIIGQRTFGKGLVQVPRDLPYGGSMKVTTSKYYIPSGRCIQAIDYSHRNADGSVKKVPDSLTTVFKTAIGREVRDGGGITPDVKLDEEKIPSMTYYLTNQYIISDWVTDWVVNHKKLESLDSFSITDEDYNNFKDFVKSKKDFKYDLLSDKRLKTLKEVMDFEGYTDTASDEYKALEAKLVPNLDRDLENFKDIIKDMINAEIAKRYFYQKGAYIQNLKSDKEVKEAIALLKNQEKYQELFTPGRKIIDETSKTGSEEEFGIE